MSPPKGGGAPRQGSPDELAGSTQASRRDSSPTEALAEIRGEQLRLFDEPAPPAESPGPAPFDIPAHRLHPAEADMRLAVNRLAWERERRHWWAREAERRRGDAA